MSADEKIRELAEMREKALHDEASCLGTARREGEETGKQKERESIINSMRNNGFSEEQIQKIINGIQNVNNVKA